MKIRPAGQDGKRLVSRIAADVRAEIHRVRGLRKEPHIRAVGVVNGQETAVTVAHLRKRGDVGAVSEIIRAGDIDGGGHASLPAQTVKHNSQLFAADLAGFVGERLSFSRCLRHDPVHLDIQQRDRVQEGPVHIARGEDTRSDPAVKRRHFQKKEHGAHTERRPLGRVERAAAEQRARVGLALGDDAAGLREHIRPVDLRDVKRLNAQRPGHSLVTGHMKPHRVAFAVGLNKIINRCVHGNPLLLRAAAGAAATKP